MDGAPRIVAATWRRVRVPFARPFPTAHGALSHREGVLLTLRAGDDLAGIGEVSPWPLFDLGDIDASARLLPALATRLIGQSAAAVATLFDDLDPAMPGLAAARCGLDMAALDLLGRARGLPVAALLGDQPAAAGVPVNATIGAVGPEAAAALAARAVAAGFTCLKVKVGAGPLAGDEARVAAVRGAAGRAARLRLDANGAWGESEARAALARLARHDLELIEQPVAAHDLGAMARLRRDGRVPIAADEAVRGVDDARRIIARGAADALVIKPMTAGGLTAGRAILDLAAAAGLAAFVTTTIDFGPGIAAALALAHAAARAGGDFARHCGLATADLLASTLVRDLPAITDGAMHLPPGPGLGVALDREAMRRWESAPPGAV